MLCRLFQGYGPSETTNICNVRSYTSSHAPINNVGSAFPNTSIFVCRIPSPEDRQRGLTNADFSPIPRGALGEIWIGGQQVARGYSRPELTSQSWLQHPEHGWLYRSGDRGRLLADGSLSIEGRLDQQIKLHGQRIELADITSTVLRHNLVQDATTLVLSTTTGQDILVVFWVPRSGHTSSNEVIQALYEHMFNHLPAYMVPSFAIEISQLPLTTHGKTDRRALSSKLDTMTPDQLDQYSSSNHRGSESSESTIEHDMVLRALANVTKIPRSQLKPHLSFMSYGVDSIMAIPFAKRVRDQGMDTIDAAAIMRNYTTDKLVSHYWHTREAAEKDQKPDLIATIPHSVQELVAAMLPQLEIETILPCTPLQLSMLASNELHSKRAYQNHVIYKLQVDDSLIQQAWCLMMQRHEILRTRFVKTNNLQYPYVQVVQKSHVLPWRKVDVLPEITLSPMEAPPFEICVSSGTAGESLLHLFIHHALHDAATLEIWQSEVEDFCHGRKQHTPVSFRNYLNFMEQCNDKKSKQFWTQTLRNLQPHSLSQWLPLTTDVGLCAIAERNSQHSLADLRIYATETQCTLLAIFQAALARLLSMYTKRDDICFGTVFSGRNVRVPNARYIAGKFMCISSCLRRRY